MVLKTARQGGWIGWPKTLKRKLVSSFKQPGDQDE
jgi:hypothetical protein